MNALMHHLQQGDSSLILHFAAGMLLGWLILYLLPTNDEAFQYPTNKRDDVKAAISDCKNRNIRKRKGNSGNASAWEGDNIPHEELEQIRKRFRLTPEQMAHAIEQSKEQSQSRTSKPPTTPHQKLNRLVYLGMFLVFPKEAKVLGLLKEAPAR
eukprot:scaffold839_cov138-Cylindrotheca_fusiformis.AAC.1